MADFDKCMRKLPASAWLHTSMCYPRSHIVRKGRLLLLLVKKVTGIFSYFRPSRSKAGRDALICGRGGVLARLSCVYQISDETSEPNKIPRLFDTGRLSWFTQRRCPWSMHRSEQGRLCAEDLTKVVNVRIGTCLRQSCPLQREAKQAPGKK